MIYIRDNQILRAGNAIVLEDGSKVPWGNLALWSADELAAVGVTALPDPVPEPEPIPPPPPEPAPQLTLEGLADLVVAEKLLTKAKIDGAKR